MLSLTKVMKESFESLLQKMITERMSYDDLLRSMDRYKTTHEKLHGLPANSADRRKDKAGDVRVKPLEVTTI